MSGIKRWDHNVCEFPWGTFSEMNACVDGGYVSFEDHEAQVARLCAEVEKLKMVKEIVSKTRRSNSDAYEQAFRNDDGLMQAVCNARTSLLNNIDAAIGASA